MANLPLPVPVPARALLLPPFRRIAAAGDLASLVEPPPSHLDPGGVFLSLRREMHRIARLVLPILRVNDLRSRRVAMHDDQRISDLYVESKPLAGGSSSRRHRRYRTSCRCCRGTVVGGLDAVMSFVVPCAENQFSVLRIKALFSRPLGFAEVVVVTCDLILDQLSVDQRLGRHLVSCTRSKRACQCHTT